MTIRKKAQNLAALFVLAVSTLVFSGTFAFGQNTYTTADLNLRTGPSTRNPVIATIPARSPVDVYGCLYERNWCEVRWGNLRGYVSQRFLAAYAPRYQPRYAPRYVQSYDPYYVPGYRRAPSVFLEFDFHSGRDYRSHKRRYRHYDRPGHRDFGKDRKKKHFKNAKRDNRKYLKKQKKRYLKQKQAKKQNKKRLKNVKHDIRKLHTNPKERAKAKVRKKRLNKRHSANRPRDRRGGSDNGRWR
jgi:uncharacterized protein YraI